MNVLPLRRRSGRQSLIRLASTAAVVAFAACSGESLGTPAEPVLPSDPGVNPQVRSLAWVFDVNTAKKSVKITPPSPAVARAAGFTLNQNGQIELSLVGADVIALAASNYSATGVGTGGAPPGRVRVTFDVAITNLLNSVELITPTFPTPPAGQTGLFMFSFENVVTTTSGGVSTDGNDVIVELPNRGGVTPSVQFDGAPHNWFNDTGCPAGANDCFRYETFAEPLAAGGTTASQQVGFDIDPTVSNFRAKMIVAADLRNAGPAITRTVSGSVTSPQIGPLTSGTVNIGGLSGAISSGAFSIAGVGSGPRTVSVTPPAGCIAPAPQSVTITASSPDPVVVNFTVTCNAPTGSVAGAINFATGSATPSLSAVQVTVTPSAAGTSPVTVSPNAAGAYTAAGVNVGTGGGAGAGSIGFANLPSGCTFVGSSTSSYSGLASGGSVTAAPVTITCPQALYPLTLTWGAPSGGTVTLTAAIDMSVRNDPLNNGAAPDQIGAYQHTFNYGTRVSAPSCTASSGFSGVINTAGSGIIGIVLTNTTGAAGTVTLFTCTFTYTAAGTTLFSAVDGSFIAGDQTGYDFTTQVNVVVNPIP